jgi:hypothetical protein
MENIRFWIHNPANVDGGFVKLTLRPDQKLAWGTCSTDEEGWSSTFESWHYDAERGLLVNDWISDGRDCDGRHFQATVFVCPLDQLRAETPNEYCHERYDCEGVMLPAWQTENQWKRDYTAEAAGY